MWSPREIVCRTDRHLHTVTSQAMLQLTCLISIYAPILAEQGPLKTLAAPTGLQTSVFKKSLRNTRKNEPTREWSPSVPAFAQTTGLGQGNIAKAQSPHIIWYGGCNKIMFWSVLANCIIDQRSCASTSNRK